MGGGAIGGGWTVSREAGWAVADVAAFVLGVRERTIDRTVSGKVILLSAYVAGVGPLRSHSLCDVWSFT